MRRSRRSRTRSRRFAPSRHGTSPSAAKPSCRSSSATCPPPPSSSSRMKADFEQWLSAQFADTGPFTVFIVLVRIADDEVLPLKSSYAHLIGDDMAWREMQGLLDRAGTAWDGVAFFVGLGPPAGPLPAPPPPPPFPHAHTTLTAHPPLPHPPPSSH